MYFQNVAVDLQKEIYDSFMIFPEIENETDVSQFNSITNEELYLTVSSSKKNTAADDDKQTATEFLMLYLVIKTTLLRIINQDFKKGQFPDSVKVFRIIPVDKIGSKNKANNYRQISLQSIS